METQQELKAYDALVEIFKLARLGCTITFEPLPTDWGNRVKLTVKFPDQPGFSQHPLATCFYGWIDEGEIAKVLSDARLHFTPH